jgi:hypothetical protein
LPFGVRLVLGVDVLAFLIGTGTHLMSLVRGVWLPHHPFLNAFWGSLTFLDPLTAVLLLRAPRAGLLLALLIMITDVGINSAASYLYLEAPGKYAIDYFVQLQSIFLGFLVGSMPFVWDGVGRDSAS